jgi:hypothetical protein
VNPKLVPDYLKIIKTPMDFSTMRSKIDKDRYTSIDQFRHDFNLITTNAKLYNSIDTIYWKSADKVQDYGTKMIDRAEKTIADEGITASPEPGFNAAQRKNSLSSRKLSVSFTGRKDSASMIKEEEVDIMGLDNIPLRKPSKGGDPDTRETSVDIASSRALTPNRTLSTYKKKKKKMADTGVVYGPDGSLYGVGGVGDLNSLVPLVPSFSDPPQLTTVNPAALPSAFYANRHAADDWFHNKHIIHSAHFCDYGPFTTLGGQSPGAFYTAQDAAYIYPLYGDDRGEAYLKSLWDFISDGDMPSLAEKVDETSRYLTRGAWDVVKDILSRKEPSVETEFGRVDVISILEKIEKKTQEETEPLSSIKQEIKEPTVENP